MKSTIYLPAKCKVGFNPRPDTYSGKLGYVIYHDGKTWRKEKSWQGWIYKVMDADTYNAQKLAHYEKEMQQNLEHYLDYAKRYAGSSQVATLPTTLEEVKAQRSFDGYYPYQLGQTIGDPSFEPYEFENVLTEGFVINKDAGGVGSGWGWHDRIEKVRIYDPRGFEIEITISNLLHILTNSNSIKGKGLEGRFVYGWDGTNLVLISEYSPEYIEMKNFSDLKNTKSLGRKELVAGEVYLFDDLHSYMYLGKYMEYNSYDKPQGVQLLFLNTKYIGTEFNSNAVHTTTTMARVKKHSHSAQSVLAETVERVLKFQRFEPKTFEEVEITDIPAEAYKYTFLTEEDGKKVKAGFQIDRGYIHSYHRKPTRYHLHVGKKIFTYESEQELFKKHKVWKLQKVLTTPS